MKLLLTILLGVLSANVESLLPNFGIFNVWLAKPVLFNPLQQKCCNGKAVDAPFGIRYRCCGTMTYDSVTQLCCKKNVQDRMKYQGRSGCCGTKVYDQKANLCCNNVIKAFPTNVSKQDQVYYTCCGSTPIDSRKNKCCGNKIVLKTKDCCEDNQIFEPYTQTCIPNYIGADNVNSRSTDSTNNSSSDSSTTATPSNTYTLKCNGQTYNPYKQLCCPSISNPSVSVLYDKPNADTMCCADKVYNLNSQTCCIDYPSGKVNVLNTTSSDQNLCCGDVPYAAPEFLCCDEKLYNRTNDNGCCGKTLYSFKKQGCCKEQVYDRTKYACCEEMLSPLNNVDYEAAACCGTTSYDQAKKTCCGRQIFDTSTGQQCCGNDVYDPKTEVCCGLKKAKITNASQTQCCLPVPVLTNLPQCYLDLLIESGQFTEENFTSPTESNPFAYGGLNPTF